VKPHPPHKQVRSLNHANTYNSPRSPHATHSRSPISPITNAKMLSSWASPIALIFCTYGTLLGLSAFTSPLSAARQFGFDLPAHVDRDFVHVFSRRNIAIGLTMYAFTFQRQYKAMGSKLLCICFGGIGIRSLRRRVREALALNTCRA